MLFVLQNFGVIMKTKFAVLSVAITLVNACLLGQNLHQADNQSTNTKENVMECFTVMQKPSIIVVGIECRTSNAPEAGPRDIPQHWGRFYSEGIVGKIPNKISDDIIALYCDYEGDYTQPYSFVIGCPVNSVDSIPEGMVAKIIPAGSYGVFHAVGEYPASLIETWGNIWQQSNLKRTYTGDYEFYGDKFSASPKEVEVFIAIEQ